MSDTSFNAVITELTHFLNQIGGYVWGPVLLILLVGTGLYLTIRMGALQFSMLPYALKLAFSRKQDDKSPGDISQFQALMTALAATIGTGNIAGVATAVVLGGPERFFGCGPQHWWVW